MEKINENENFYRIKIKIKKAYCQNTCAAI